MAVYTKINSKDINYIEKMAREKYKMVKTGEKILKVVTK